MPRISPFSLPTLSLAIFLTAAACSDGTVTTPPAGDTTPPQVVSIVPADGATEVARNADIVIVFSEAMDQSSVTGAFSLGAGSAHVATGVSYDPSSFTVTVSPTADLDPYAQYTLSTTGTLKDAAGNALSGGVSTSFRTIDDVAPLPPAAPTDMGAYVGMNVVAFTWTASTDAGTGVASYVLQVGTTAGGNDVFDGDVGDVLFYEVTGADGETLYARVAAVDDAGNQSTFSSSSDGITIDLTQPSAPGTPSDDGDQTSSSSLTFDWTAAADAQSNVVDYLLLIGTTPGGNELFEGLVGNVTTYTIDDVPHGSTVYAMVAAVNGADLMGDFSTSSDGILVDLTPPPTPSAPVDEGVYSADAALVFTWTVVDDPETGITGYHLRVGTTAGGSDVFDDLVGDVTSYEVTGSNGQTLYASVAAVNGLGVMGDFSTSSDGITIDSTVPAQPAAPTDDGEWDDGTVTLQWVAVSGAASYRLQAGTTPGASDILDEDVGNVTTYDLDVFTELPTFTNGGTVYARVAAVDGAAKQGVFSPSSDGIRIDITPPLTMAAPLDRGDYDDENVHFTWDAAADDESPIVGLTLVIGTTPGANDVDTVAISDGTATSFDFDATAWHGATLYAYIYATNTVQLDGDASPDSDGVTIDTQDPWVFLWAGPTMPIHADITVFFSEPMDLAGVEAGLALRDSGNAVPQHGYGFYWSMNDRAVTIMPDTMDPAGITNADVLQGGETYTVELGDTVTDLAGNPAIFSGNTSFAAQEYTSPQLVSAVAGATDLRTTSVARSDLEAGDALVLTFDQDMKTDQGSVGIHGMNTSVGWDDLGSTGYGLVVAWQSNRVLTVTFTAEAQFQSSVYEIYVSASAADGWGTWLQVPLYVRTDPARDTVAPKLVSTIPSNGRTGVARTFPILLMFDEVLRPETLGGITVTGAGISAADFEFFAEAGSSSDGPSSSGTMVGFKPRTAMPASLSVTVNVPGTVKDLAGNAFTATSLSFTTASADDVAIPQLVETMPPDGATVRPSGFEFVFEDSASLLPERVLAEELDADDVAVTNLTTGRPMRGWQVSRGSSDLGVRLWGASDGATWLGISAAVGVSGAGIAQYTTEAPHDLMNGDEVVVHGLPGCNLPSDLQFDSTPLAITVVDATTFEVNLATTGDPTGDCGMVMISQSEIRVTLSGVHDAYGNAAAPASADFVLTNWGGARYQWPVSSGWQGAQVVGNTSAGGRSLEYRLNVEAPSDTSVNYAITDNLTSGFSDSGSIDTSTGNGYARVGGDGPPIAIPAMNGGAYGASGFYAYDMTLSTAGATYTVTRHAWVWQPNSAPVLDTVGGVTPSAGGPVRVTTTTPTFAWSNIDVTNADLLQLFVVSADAISGNDEGGGTQHGFMLDPLTASFALPATSALPAGTYLWAVAQSKFLPGNLDAQVGNAWSLDMAALMGGDMTPFFIVGPSNTQLAAVDYAVAALGARSTGDSVRTIVETAGRYGTLTFDGSLLGFEIGENDDGTSVNEILLYGYDAASTTLALTSQPSFSTVHGWLRDNGTHMLTAGTSSDGVPTIAVGAKLVAAPGGTWGVEDFDGSWHVVGGQLDLASDPNYFEVFSGKGLTDGAGNLAMTIANKDGSDSFATTYTVTADGLVTILGGDGTEVSGFIGGAVGHEILPMSFTDTTANTAGLALLYRGHDVADAFELDGDYVFAQLQMNTDSGEAMVMRGRITLTATDATTGTGHYVMQMGGGTFEGTIPYAVDAAIDTLVIPSQDGFFTMPIGAAGTFMAGVDTGNNADHTIIVLAR